MPNEVVAKRALAGRDILLAAWSNHVGVVRQLLKAGVHPDAPAQEDTNLSGTALFFAARYGNADMITALIEQHADIDAPGLHGCTPLLECVNPQNNLDWADRVRAMKLLLDYGASTAVCDQDGHSILHSLVQFTNPDCPQMIALAVEHGADPNRKTIVKLISQKPMGGDTPLHTVAWKGSRHAVDPLLRSGADLNALDGAGNTPLMVAARCGTSMKTVQKDGRNLRVPDDPTGHAVIVGQFIAAGALTNIRNHDGKTAIDLAQEGRHQHIMEILRATKGISNRDTGMIRPSVAISATQGMQVEKPVLKTPSMAPPSRPWWRFW